MATNCHFDPLAATLEACGFRFTISADSLSAVRDGWVRLAVTLVLDERVQGDLRAKTVCCTPVADIVRLKHYLLGALSKCDLTIEEASLELNGPYVPADLAFELEVVDSEKFDEGGGEATIGAAINIGKSGLQSVYVAARSGVSFNAILRFAMELERLALLFTNTNPTPS